MLMLSNKREALKDIFACLDVEHIGRIDTMELFAVIFLALEGKYEMKVINAMNIFGFSSDSEFSRDEAHFYFDCLFRGIMKFAIPQGHSVPILAGKHIKNSDITNFVDLLYPGQVQMLERKGFLESMFNKQEVGSLLYYF